MKDTMYNMYIHREMNQNNSYLLQKYIDIHTAPKQ